MPHFARKRRSTSSVYAICPETGTLEPTFEDTEALLAQCRAESHKIKQQLADMRDRHRNDRARESTICRFAQAAAVIDIRREYDAAPTSINGGARGRCSNVPSLCPGHELVVCARSLAKRAEMEVGRRWMLHALRRAHRREEEALRRELVRERDAALPRVRTEKESPYPPTPKRGILGLFDRTPLGRGIVGMENCPKGVSPTIPLHPRSFRRLLYTEV